MNKFFLIILFLIFGISACAGKPRIEFREISHDFGIVKQESELKHVFVFKNTGSSLLHIEKIKST